MTIAFLDHFYKFIYRDYRKQISEQQFFGLYFDQTDQKLALGWKSYLKLTFHVTAKPRLRSKLLIQMHVKYSISLG